MEGSIHARTQMERLGDKMKWLWRTNLIEKIYIVVFIYVVITVLIEIW